MAHSLFRPGQNCAGVGHADRVAFVVDADDYFRNFVHACERAQHDILILAWDFDSRTPLCQDEGKPAVVLGEFLNGLCARNRNLRIRILDWDFPLMYGTDREYLLSPNGSWRPHRRIDFRYDNTHPFAGSHHQKIVVIDDKLAFSGGLDITNRRWDTCEHSACEPRRSFDGDPYAPVHDVMIAVDGDAAKALARVARERWQAATGEKLKPGRSTVDPWPEGLPVDASGVDVAVSCTAPPTDEHEGTYHIEVLFEDMIARATRYVYIENQYFTSRRIDAMLRKSLAAPTGPEVVVVTRLLSHGWLEELTMTTLRNQLVNDLRAADARGRFHVFYADVPGLPEGMCLDVHSKVMIVDDEWLRIGSANLSDRSLGMDTECDVTVEAKGDARAREAIHKFCCSLIGEHVGAEPEVVAQRIASSGGLAAAIAGLGSPARSLKRLEVPKPPRAKLAVAGAGDPDQPIFENIAKRDQLVSATPNGFLVRRALYVIVGLIVAAIALSLVWTQTSLGDYLTRENATALAAAFAGKWWAPLVVVLAYTPASFIMFPRWIITTTAVLAFGPWAGFVYAMTGVLIAGVVTFLPGRIVSRDTMRRLAGKRLRPLTKFMEWRGLVGVVLVRLVPIAPFPVVNLVLGALRVKLWQFVLGTAIGMLPGMIAATVLSDQLAAALEGSARLNPWLIAAAVAALGAIAFFSQRYMRRVAAR